MLQSVPDVEAVDRDHEGRRGGAREPMTTQQISTAQRARSRVRLFALDACYRSLARASFFVGGTEERLRVGTGELNRIARSTARMSSGDSVATLDLSRCC